MRFASFLLLSCFALTAWVYAQDGGPGLAPPRGASAREFVRGIDVGKYQGKIDWPRVARSGVQFAIVRAGDGLKRDVEFATNWNGAKAAGILRGSYQYFRASLDGAAQAKDLLDQIPSLEATDLPPAVDVETLDGGNEARLVAELEKWITTVRQRTGRRPLLYASHRNWAGWHMPATFGQETSLWLIHYSSSPGELPAGWSDWTIWQWGHREQVPGVSGPVDGDRFRGTLADLRAFIASTATARPKTPAPSPAPSPSPSSSSSSSVGLAGAVDSTAGAPAATQRRLPELERGASGDDVRRLQTMLRADGAPLAVDGTFGPETEEAVREFQRTHACTVDGIVGPETWGALDKAAGTAP
jgi:lysozyme